ncbi:unnamed protein product [Phaedon cochleariae]|uniref:Prokaryotic-type class I peptide chain release factors domain-containing protein n=1 Tax=Phaedon cochleariae TaxID=80249 RepID=A0A9P0GT89_PHACE|nr:unnamed protein product [Phaedon cochleariae]
MTLLRKSLEILKLAYNFKSNLSLRRKYSSLPSYDLNLKLNGTSLNNYIINLQNEYDNLLKNNINSGKRWLELQPIIQILKDREDIVKNLNNLKELLEEKDSEIAKMARDEKVEMEEQISKVDKKLIQALIPVDKEDVCNDIVLEVQAGVGGQEAMLFAKEMFDMYCNFSQHKGWQLEIAEYATTDIGGLRYASALINGPSVFSYFKHEAGIHRVQRIPTTEKAGRLHTSTVSVIALPQPHDIEVNINPGDLKIETKRSTGAGGQHVNTTDSAVRIVHLPTGIAVECQVDRSQIKNRKMAMARLNALLYQRKLEAQTAESDAARKSQVRTRNWNEKIRTYNFSQDRITDHRLGVSVHNLKVFLEGGEPLED